MTWLQVLVVSLLAAALIGAEPIASETGALRGRVFLSEGTAPAEHRPSISDLGSGRHEAIDRRRSVVYFESAPRQAFDELRTVGARMDQHGEQFVPRVLAITVGTTVDFPNDDTTFHNVFSLSPTKTFDLGRYAPGRTGSKRFDRPGIVQVFCDIHSHMRGYILVFSHPFFAVTDDEGHYAIAGVPPGTYTLMVWSELGHAEPMKVTIVDGEVAEADFHVVRQP